MPKKIGYCVEGLTSQVETEGCLGLLLGREREHRKNNAATVFEMSLSVVQEGAFPSKLFLNRKHLFVFLVVEIV